MTLHSRKDNCTAASAHQGAAQFFDDLHKPLTDLMAVKEADHCLYCYDAPCIQACPTSIDIPTFIHQIRTGNVSGSARTILSENIMGGTCARACPTEVLCEQACVHNLAGTKPVENRSAATLCHRSFDSRRGGSSFPTGSGYRTSFGGDRWRDRPDCPLLTGPPCSAIRSAFMKLGPSRAGLMNMAWPPIRWSTTLPRGKLNSCWALAALTSFMTSLWAGSLPLGDMRAQHDAVFIGVGLGGANEAWS